MNVRSKFTTDWKFPIESDKIKNVKQVSCVHGRSNITLEKVALNKGLPHVMENR